jgi:MscS family membrane protein
MTLETFLQSTVGPWTAGEILPAFLILVGAFILRTVVIAWLGRRLAAVAALTATEADDIAFRSLIGPAGSLVMVVGVYMAFRMLAPSIAEVAAWSDRIFRVLLTLIIAWGVFRLVDAVAIILGDLAARTENPFDDNLVPVLRKAAKVLVTVMAFLLAAQNMGYSVSGLLAGLGLGGLAFALAAKDTIANLFGGVTILADRPFRIGDWVTFDGTDGVVEEIGLRSTRIRTFAKTLTTVPNQALSNAVVENHSLMPKRRVKMTVGVTYDASPDQMRTLVDGVEGYLKAHAGVDQEFMLVKFTEFGTSSLNLFIYFFSGTTEWAAHLQVRQEVNLGIMDLIEDMGLSIAFPTQTLHLVQESQE